MATCPNCGSTNTVLPKIPRPEAAACLGCATLFVPETRARPEAQLCNDCAFRPGSPERADPYKWAEIVETTIVDAVHPFFCHKGLTCSLDGNTLKYQIPQGGQAAMTPCAGWRAHKAAYDAGTPAREL